MLLSPPPVQMLRVSVGLIRISPQRKLHKSLKCQTLRYHHSRQMGFFSQRLSFVVFFFVAALLGAPAARHRPQLFKAAQQKEETLGSSRSANKEEPTSRFGMSNPSPNAAAAPNRLNRLTSSGPPFNTGARWRQLPNPRDPWSHTPTCPQLPCARRTCSIINKIC